MVMQSYPMPTEIKKPDEPKSSSNRGINIALILTLVLSIMLLIGALFFVPHDNFSPTMSPEGSGLGVPMPNTAGIPPGTKGEVINKPTPERNDNKSYLLNQQVQGDTISPVGPGGFSKMQH